MKLVIDPDGLRREKYPTTFIYQQLMEQEVPMKWKDGAPPKDRDATEKDIRFPNGAIRISNNEAEAVW